MASEQDVAEDARHAAKMAKKKAARDRMMAEKIDAALGNYFRVGNLAALRELALLWVADRVEDALQAYLTGHGIKGAWETGERRLLTSNFGQLCQFYAMGEGFTWETQDRTRDIAAAQAGWEKAKALIADENLRMVVLDEINIALRYDYLDINEVIEFLQNSKPPLTHVVLTGRNAKQELIDAADLVTEMTLVKHPFRSGIKAQPGVEF